MEYTYEDVNCNTFKGICAFNEACDIIKPNNHMLEFFVSDLYKRHSSILMTSENLRIDGSLLGEEFGTCYIPVLRNQVSSDTFILG